ncbi:MAG: Ig-like domain-containing protein [Micropepsaceae bacterium]
MRSPRLPSIALRLSLVASSMLLGSGPAFSGATYAYDALGRLVQVRYDDGKQITYAYDAAGNRTQTVVATTSGSNQPPVANPDTFSFGENETAITFNPRTNDTDPDANSLNLFSVTNGSLGTAALSNSSTTITYSSTNHSVASDTLYYTINDGAGAEATGQITVSFTNLPPVAVNDSISTVRNSVKVFDPRVNDSDPGNDPITIFSTSTPLHGTATVIEGSWINYAPTTGYYGTDSFTYTIHDSDGGASTATVSVAISYGSSPPVANNDSKTTAFSTAFTFDPRTNDSDPDGGPLTITAKTNGTKGVVTINAGASVTYTPNTGVSGADSFTYTITDADGLTATATVSVTIDVAAGPPVAVNDSVELYGTFAAGQGGSQPTGSIDPRWNDTGGNLTITNVTQPTNGSAAITGGGTAVTITRTNTCPGPQAVGPVTYTISNGAGTATGTITSTITCENTGNQ